MSRKIGVTGKVRSEAMSLDDSLFLRTCRRQPTDKTPVWFMRQAGRSLPEYRQIRGTGSILDAIKVPELAAAITTQPVTRYGVDAAILFSDIMVPIASVGFGIDIKPGVGPVIDEPFRSRKDLDRLRDFEPEADTPYVLETVRILAKELRVPLIGFAGAPFTIASYLVEGGPSNSYARTKALMHSDPSTWGMLMERLAEVSVRSMQSQVHAGAAAVQLFDSWVGALSPDDYANFVLPYTRIIFRQLADLDVPRLHFGVGTGELLTLIAETGADVIGVDWRVPIDVASKRLGPGVAIQGNLDPAICLAPWEVVATQTRDILRRASGRPGHIFNLGHGVMPETNPDILTKVVELVHSNGE